MKLLDKLKVSYETVNPNLRLLEHIHFADSLYSLSIQASTFHYCKPRMTLSLGEYTHFEVMVNIPKYDVPKNWLNDYDAGGDVFAYVPVKEIENLLNTLDKKYKML